MLTMVLGGLWHGAAWGFVLWGALHGAGLGVERLLRGRLHAPAWLRWAIVFNLVVFGWVLFRADNLDVAWSFISRSSYPVGDALGAGNCGGGGPGHRFPALPPQPLERLRLRVTELPSDGYRDAMEIDGRRQIVRDADGIHRTATGRRSPRTSSSRRSGADFAAAR